MGHKSWFVPRMWKDGECWIIGGGMSFPRQFGIPAEIIEKVLRQELPISSYSDWMKPIHDRHVIGTNIAFKLGHWLSAVYFCDKAFFLANRRELINFQNLKVTDANNMPIKFRYDSFNIKRMRRDQNKTGLSKDRDMISWNGNAGGGAINLAVHAGVKRILLLGYDMKPDELGRTHWHAGEINYHKPTNQATFDRFIKYYDEINKSCNKLGVEVLNVNPDSAIEVFKKVKLEEVL